MFSITTTQYHIWTVHIQLDYPTDDDVDEEHLEANTTTEMSEGIETFLTHNTVPAFDHGFTIVICHCGGVALIHHYEHRAVWDALAENSRAFHAYMLNHFHPDEPGMEKDTEMNTPYTQLELWEITAENNYGQAQFMVWKAPDETLEQAFRQQYPAPSQPTIVETRRISAPGN